MADDEVDDLSKVKNKRSALKARLTRTQNYLDSLDRVNFTIEIIKEIETRLVRLEPILDEFETVQSTIEIAEKIEIDANERDIFENKYYAVTAKLKAHLESFHINENNSRSHGPNSETSSVHTDENENQTHGGFESRRKVKLPDIKLPTFTGDYAQWSEFKELFDTLINQDKDLPDIQKFYYLKGCLADSVKKIINKLEVTAPNYEKALKILSERYENKILLIHNHLQAIFNLPTVNKASHVEIRNLYDSTVEHLSALKSLGEETEHWDRLIIFILSKKFDSVTLNSWESHKLKGELPTLEDMEEFIKTKCNTLEKIYKFKNVNDKSIFETKKSQSFASLSENKIFKCYVCSQEHSIFKCEKFVNLPVLQKIETARNLKLCLNCLRASHPTGKCRLSKCLKCHKPHNTMLHIPTENKTNNRQSTHETVGGIDSCLEPAAGTSSSAALNSISDRENKQTLNNQVLLATAIIKVKNFENKWILCRALLDSASQSNFLTERTANKLKLPKIKLDHVVKGVGQGLTNISDQINIEIESMHNNYKTKIRCLILEKITDNLPTCSFNINTINIPDNIKLADNTLNVSKEVHILLGSNIFWEVICGEQKRLGPNGPFLQNTLFGWVMAGNLNMKTVNTSISCFSSSKRDIDLDDKLTKFWSIEELEKKKYLSDSEKYCENQFEKTVARDDNGRFIVTLPFTDNLKYLGESYNMALTRFESLERKLIKNIDLKKSYSEFIQELEILNHMSNVTCLKKQNTNYIKDGYFLPHHAVIKPGHLTSPIRVVFDASAKSTSGISLNDTLHVGPTLQQDVFSILGRFRLPKYVMTADISKMYRQVFVRKEDRKYQRILWREKPTDEINIFEINRVVYGMASSPYLAVKCLFKLAEENQCVFPEACEVIRRDFYMDDLLTGSNSQTEILNLQRDISQILASAGFELRKWLCNDKELLNKFEVRSDLQSNVLHIGENEQNKTLGIYWDSNNDLIKYKVNNLKNSNITLTKRIILSLTCQIFDPLCLLGPFILIPKLLMQDLWKLKLGWDDDVPQNIANTWKDFQNDLLDLPKLAIPRQTIVPGYRTIELHGFSDSSEKAYSACVYIRCVMPSGEIFSNLLCAKSRVAPIKKISLPRLELSGALLLANLIEKVKSILNVRFDEVFYWTDSMITLAWIKGSPDRWKTFVANRSSEIQSLTDLRCWHHVKSLDNPADLLSRGTNLTNLKNNKLWWYGPAWFQWENSMWNLETTLQTKDIPDQKTMSHLSVNNHDLIHDLIQNSSSLIKLQKTLATMLRFINNSRNPKGERKTGPLEVKELDNALKLLIKSEQITKFPNDYENLQKKRVLKSKSQLLSLNPFLSEGLLRVGGRISNAKQTYDKKFPVILPRSSKLTSLILRSEHERLLHCGIQALLCSVRDKYWPISGRNSCKKIVNQCVICFKVNPRDNVYLMGDLPDFRVNNYSPFFNVGVDYGGPFLVKDRKTRGAKLLKSYICLFVCMSTKAVHIELVSELTTDAFFAAFNRFISRRGKPQNVYSDNGSNFIGANNELSKISEFFKGNSDQIHKKFSAEQIKWHFIPARSPHFGGVWEAGIRSTKHHIKRLVTHPLTYEDFYTLLVQIEGILNSRPLCPLTEDPDDLTALTPSHLLIGKKLTTLPEADLRDIACNRLNRWQHIQALVQHYWTRWSKEYLSELQTRRKWKRSQESVKTGALVLLKNEDVPPRLWHLGRITQCCPGKDGTTRVVNVKTQNGTVTRAVNKICVLPIECN